MQNSQGNSAVKSFFNELTGCRPASLLKKDSTVDVFLSVFHNFQNGYSIEQLQTAAFDIFPNITSLPEIRFACFKTS